MSTFSLSHSTAAPVSTRPSTSGNFFVSLSVILVDLVSRDAVVDFLGSLVRLKHLQNSELYVSKKSLFKTI